MNIATLRFTPADQRTFAPLSGDFNPVHQTATILPVRAHDPVTVLLPIIRDIQRASSGPGR